MNNKKTVHSLSFLFVLLLSLTLSLHIYEEQAEAVCIQSGLAFSEKENTDRYEAPFGDITGISLIAKNPGYSVTTYEIYIHFSANQNFSSVSINTLSLTNGNVLNPVAYTTINGINCSTGGTSSCYVKAGEITLPSTVTYVYAQAIGVSIVFYSTGSLSVSNYHGPVYFN